MRRESLYLECHVMLYLECHAILFCLLYTGLLIGCGKKWEILRHFQGKLCGKKGPLCGKLCDFFKADLIFFCRSQREKPIFLLSNEQLEHKKKIKASKLNQLLPNFNYFNLK